KEEETRTRKPFVATLRITSPARHSLASSRKRVLRGGLRPPLHSVDSQSRCRAIEPRNLRARRLNEMPVFKDRRRRPDAVSRPHRGECVPRADVRERLIPGTPSMSVKIIPFAAVLVVQSPALAAPAPPKRAPRNPPPLPALTPIPAGEAVVAAWGKAKHHFTPEVKAA